MIEADEYDTAFFDKRSKFLHYPADYVVLNNLEFDHADIFADLEAMGIDRSPLDQLYIQLIGIVSVGAFCFVSAFGIFFVINFTPT